MQCGYIPTEADFNVIAAGGLFTMPLAYLTVQPAWYSICCVCRCPAAPDLATSWRNSNVTLDTGSSVSSGQPVRRRCPCYAGR
jgi:hypothetical protein